FRIEASLSGDRLVVRFRGVAIEQRAPRTLPVIRSIPTRRSPSSCASCGVLSCFRNEERTPAESSHGKTAYVVDRYWPEFEEFIRMHKQPGDVIGIPLDGKLLRRPRYRWDTGGFEKVKSASMATLKRSLALRHLPPQGARRQQTLLKHDREL